MWKIYVGKTMIEILEEEGIDRLRIIFMSMYNDLVFGEKNQERVL